MEVPEELIYNFLIDLKKKDIDPINRAKIIKTYLLDKNLSVRGLAKKLGMPHSTLQDWMDYSRISENDFNRLLDNGYSKKTVYKMLRETRADKDAFFKIADIELNILIKDTDVKFREHVSNPKHNEHTLVLLKDLRNTLNRLEFHIEQLEKKKK